MDSRINNSCVRFADWFVPITRSVAGLIAFAIAGSLVQSDVAEAQTCSAYTYNMTNGTTADADQVMGNFNKVRDCVNAVTNSKGPTANLVSASNGSLGSSGTFDISLNTGGGAFTGILSISSAYIYSANTRTQTVYAVMGRGTTCTFTTLSSVEGSNGPMGFSLSCPSTGTVRFTNTTSLGAMAEMTFSGGFGY